MKPTDAIASLYRRYRTRGVPVIDCVSLGIEHGKRGVRVRFQLEARRWHGRELWITAAVYETGTHRIVGRGRQTASWPRPIWDEILPEMKLTVPVPGPVNCYALLTVYDGATELFHGTSSPLRYRPAPRKAPHRPNKANPPQPAPPRAKTTAPPRQPEQPPPVLPKRPPQTGAEKILDLYKPFGAAELRTAYLRALSLWHPDHFARASAAERETATARTRAIIEAHRKLARRSAS